MDIKLPFEFKVNLRTFMRRAGYAEFNDFNANKISYARRLGTDFYPRFHVYINQKDGFDFLSLHLDQKKASYAGSRAHSGEYSGELVEGEANRLLGLVKNQMDNQQTNNQMEEKPKSILAKIFKF
ncbi:MAG: hypothetical protein JW816_01200 [Candidatus Buchananbacteria bacterium]|nr:hypothetical protein [Candidatus Buchananbacteria bacterium]